jgi:chemotaxis signal transduction protein
VLGPAARLVVLTVEGVAAGLAVDAVEGTDSIPARGDDCPAGLTGPGVGLLAGQVPRDDGPIGVLDARAVLRLRDTLPRARRPA